VPDLVISQELSDSAAKVHAIIDELEHQKSDDNQYHGVFGESHLQDAFSDFSGDWKLHREKIRKNVDKLDKNLQNSIETWTDLQQQLKDGLQSHEETA
jgi:hypothetical protein